MSHHRTLRSQWDKYGSGAGTIDKVEYAYDYCPSQNLHPGRECDAAGWWNDAPVRRATGRAGSAHRQGYRTTPSFRELGNFGTDERRSRAAL